MQVRESKSLSYSATYWKTKERSLLINLPGVSNLLASPSHMLNTQTLTKADEQKRKVLDKFTVSCWATFIAILGHMQHGATGWAPKCSGKDIIHTVRLINKVRQKENFISPENKRKDSKDCDLSNGECNFEKTTRYKKTQKSSSMSSEIKSTNNKKEINK